MRFDRISDVLPAELVLPAVVAQSKDNILELLAARVAAFHPHADHHQLLGALRERERQASTALVHGVAIPHARVAGLPGIVAAFARSQAGVPCDAHDGQPTHLFFLLVAPLEAPGTHLRLLATVSRVLHDERCRTRLMRASDEHALLEVLRDEEERVHRAARAA